VNDLCVVASIVANKPRELATSGDGV
jgi:hypothetical protein